MLCVRLYCLVHLLAEVSDSNGMSRMATEPEEPAQTMRQPHLPPCTAAVVGTSAMNLVWDDTDNTALHNGALRSTSNTNRRPSSVSAVTRYRSVPDWSPLQASRLARPVVPLYSTFGVRCDCLPSVDQRLTAPDASTDTIDLSDKIRTLSTFDLWPTNSCRVDLRSATS